MNIALCSLILSGISLIVSATIGINVYRYNRRQKKLERWTLFRERFIDIKINRMKMLNILNEIKPPMSQNENVVNITKSTSNIQASIDALDIEMSKDPFNLTEEYIESKISQSKELSEMVKLTLEMCNEKFKRA
jgi:hypothetical protein